MSKTKKAREQEAVSGMPQLESFQAEGATVAKARKWKHGRCGLDGVGHESRQQRGERAKLEGD